MPILIHVVGHDDLARPLAKLVVASPDGINLTVDPVVGDRVFAVLPELGRFRADDRGIVKRPMLSTAWEGPRMIGDLMVGDVIACQDAVGWPSGNGSGTDIRLVGHPSILGNADTDERAAALAEEWIKEASAASTFGSVSLHGEENLDFEAAAEHARSQPEEALILAWNRDDGNIATHVLARKGSYMFFAEGSCCEDVGIPIPEAPGLWVLSEGRAFSHVDWETQVVDDYGLDGRLAEVTAEDGAARFGFDGADSLRAEMLTVLDDYSDEEPGAVEVAMALGCTATPTAAM